MAALAFFRESFRATVWGKGARQGSEYSTAGLTRGKQVSGEYGEQLSGSTFDNLEEMGKLGSHKLSEVPEEGPIRIALYLLKKFNLYLKTFPQGKRRPRYVMEEFIAVLPEEGNTS